MTVLKDGVPKSGEYDDGKLWFYRKASVITLGITSSALDELGEIESIELPDEGEDFVKSEAVVTLEGTRGKIELTTPASGIVQEINSAVKDEPTLVTEDPLEEGWLVKIEIEDPSDLKDLVSAAD